MSDSWRQLSVCPLAPRGAHVAAWTGEEMIVWGGKGRGYLGDGARYDPRQDRWAAICTAGAPAARWLHAAAWTGRELAIWGGANDRDSAIADGALYDPATDSWRPIAPFEIDGESRGRNCAGMVWTGSALLVWGGMADDSDIGLGGLYDPASETWRAISTDGEPARRHDHCSLWTGDRLVVWGGFANDKSGGDGTGGCYDPQSDQWTPIATDGAPKPRTKCVAVWTGEALLLWGGWKGGKTCPRDGGIFYPASDQWTPIARSKDAPTPRLGHRGVWTGDELLLWGGSSLAGCLGDGGRFDPATKTWGALPSDGAPSPRSAHTAVWTGQEMIVWGGQLDHNTPLDDGAMLRPRLPV